MATGEADREQHGELSVDGRLARFVREEALPGTGLEEAGFWAGASALLEDLAPRVAELVAVREGIQSRIDDYHRATPGAPDPGHYERFLRDIGYLVPEPGDVAISTEGVDPEVAVQAGPQLVVPLLNARFATNAANARWGSLYDALYGSDVVDEAGGKERSSAYNPVRGAEVVARARAFLDAQFPLTEGTHAAATAYGLDDEGLLVTLGDRQARLTDPAQLKGFQGDRAAPDAVLLVHHGLHAEVQVDRDHPVGAADAAGIKDVVLESALTCIMDLEDSVAAVDAEDKVVGYRNWLLLMQRRLEEQVTKGGRTFTRTLAADRTYLTPDGGRLTLPGRALLFVRQVGHLMTTDAVLDEEGREVPEGIVDALVTGLGSLHDLRGPAAGGNSRTGSVYVVKPKLHGPEEVALACRILAGVEEVLDLPPRTIKIGVMDEERRTSVNLKACIAAASDRLVFVNTGFLDRTGDEIHTSMHAGPMVPKGAMKEQPWILAYEDANVDIALECGLPGRAQIGKGMWAAPDNLREMLEQKLAHPRAGASCAWVPSPTAATLHALHYHEVDVAAVQRDLARRLRTEGRRTTLDELLTLPLGDPSEWDEDTVRFEVDNNSQGILGYVVRWVDAGIGCSKVPDIHGTPLMEDRATCRISSQHLANWLLHGVVDRAAVEAALARMAAVVDGQNSGDRRGDPTYLPMSPALDGEAFRAATELVLGGVTEASGYTEPVLHRHRRAVKAATTPT
jgi:malate synthase